MRDKLHIELAKLKEKYDNKRVSVMVGAGLPIMERVVV